MVLLHPLLRVCLLRLGGLRWTRMLRGAAFHTCRAAPRCSRFTRENRVRGSRGNGGCSVEHPYKRVAAGAAVSRGKTESGDHAGMADAPWSIPTRGWKRRWQAGRVSGRENPGHCKGRIAVRSCGKTSFPKPTERRRCETCGPTDGPDGASDGLPHGVNAGEPCRSPCAAD